MRFEVNIEKCFRALETKFLKRGISQFLLKFSGSDPVTIRNGPQHRHHSKVRDTFKNRRELPGKVVPMFWLTPHFVIFVDYFRLLNICYITSVQTWHSFTLTFAVVWLQTERWGHQAAGVNEAPSEAIPSGLVSSCLLFGSCKTVRATSSCTPSFQHGGTSGRSVQERKEALNLFFLMLFSFWKADGCRRRCYVFTCSTATNRIKSLN